MPSKGGIDMNGFVYDSSGAFVNNWPFPRYETLDEMDEACGDILESFEGGRIEDILVVWDALDGEDGDWFFDAPIILRLDRGDVVVDILSGMRGGIAFEHIDTNAPVTVLDCDNPDAYEMDCLYDLSWRSYEPLVHLRGLTVEQFYWRGDDRARPIALGCRLQDGRHLRIGGTYDEAEPTLVDPLAPDGDAILDDIILPVKFKKPAKETPVIAEVWEPEGIPYRLLLLDSSWLDHGCKRDARRMCVFVGGLTIPCVIEQTRPPTWRGIGIKVSEEEVPAEFRLGKMAEIV